MVRGTLLFRPPMSSLTRNNSTRGSEKASLSNMAPARTDTTARVKKPHNVPETKMSFQLVILHFLFVFVLSPFIRYYIYTVHI